MTTTTMTTRQRPHGQRRGRRQRSTARSASAVSAAIAVVAVFVASTDGVPGAHGARVLMQSAMGTGAMGGSTSTYAPRSTYGDRMVDQVAATPMTRSMISTMDSASSTRPTEFGERLTADGGNADANTVDRMMMNPASSLDTTASSFSTASMTTAATIGGGEMSEEARPMSTTTATTMVDDSDSTVTDAAGIQEVQDADATFEETAKEQAEDENTEISFADVVAFRLKELKMESSDKQKLWLEKARKAHELEGAASFTEDEEVCGRAGPLAVYTIWNHVVEEVREAIVDFMTASETESESPHSLLALRTKTARVVKAYDIKFGGRGEELRQCIGNYYVRRRVHEVMEHLEATKEARGEVIKALNAEESNAEQIRIGRVAQRLKKVVMSQIAPVEKFDKDDNVGGTSLVLALNCRAKHPTRLLAAVAHALRARFALGPTDFTLVVGRNSVEDELMTLFQKPASDYITARASESSGSARVKSPEEVCPDLPGIEGPPEPELSPMEKAMRDAENHVLLEHQGSNDPTNPQHLDAGASLGMGGTLPGMPQMFNGKNNNVQASGDSARLQARAHFGLNDNTIGTHNTDHLRSRADMRQQSYDESASRGPVGFNAMPALQDPLAGYLQQPARPNAYNTY